MFVVAGPPGGGKSSIFFHYAMLPGISLTRKTAWHNSTPGLSNLPTIK
jgi:hypothetical protein